MPVELRLLGINNIEEANKALPVALERHNRQYQVFAAESADAYTPLTEGVKLEYVFAKRYTRKVGSGNEISYDNRIYVPFGSRHCFEARTTLEIRETFSGEVIAWHKGQAVELREIDRAERIKQKSATGKTNTKKTPKPYKPAADHPWRRGARYEKQSEQNISAAIAS